MVSATSALTKFHLVPPKNERRPSQQRFEGLVTFFLAWGPGMVHVNSLQGNVSSSSDPFMIPVHVHGATFADVLL